MDSFEKARDALQRIEVARHAEERARREQRDAWLQLQEALAELRSSSPSLQAMPMEALLQADPDTPGPVQVVSEPPSVAPSDDGARGDDNGLPPGPGDDFRAEQGDPVFVDEKLAPAEPGLDGWSLPSELQHPVEGEEDGYAAWAGLLEEELGDEQDAGPFPESE